jgi:hypothetical protein
MFRLNHIYKAVDSENQPSVIDELGHVRVIGSNLRFLVGHWGDPWPGAEYPIYAYFEPVDPCSASSNKSP